MIPRIRRIRRCKSPILREYKYEVVGFIDDSSKAVDVVRTLPDAIRYWLYHCNVSPRICFWTWKKR